MAQLHQRWGIKCLKLLIIHNFKGFLKLWSHIIKLKWVNFLALQGLIVLSIADCNNPASLSVYQPELIFINTCPDINVRMYSAMCFKETGQSCDTRMTPESGTGKLPHGVSFRCMSVGNKASRWKLAYHLPSWMAWTHPLDHPLPSNRGPRHAICRPALSPVQHNRRPV